MYAITIVSGLFKGEKDRARSNKALGHMLEALFRLDCEYLADNPGTPPLYSAGVRYRREPLGQERWLDVPTILEMPKEERFGDCEDLACWRAAELWVHGVPARPAFRYRQMVTRGGKPITVYHIVVLLPNGTTEDPSRALGMGGPGDESPWRHPSPYY